MPRKHTTSCLVLLLVATAAQAAPITVERLDAVYELAADGTSTTEWHTVTRINEQGAVASYSQQGIAYSPSRHEVEVIEAYTTSSDGTRVDVDRERIVDQQHPASTRAPAYSDYRIRNVIFAQVEVGATVTMRYRMKVREPALPGVFANGESYNRLLEIRSASLTLRAPEGVPMQVYARDVQGGPVQSTRPGMREWRWTHGPTTAETRENGSVDEASISPGVMFSNVADYPALADVFMRDAAATMKVTPAVQRLADEITRGATGSRARAEAIYRWVGSEIRPVDIPQGYMGWVPRAADEILADRQGDSKDKSALLIALLAAKGIRAVPALINTANRYKWQEIPLPSPFTRVITYVPEFDLYLDAMALAPFDALPQSLRGRDVLVAGDGQLKSAVRQTPAVDPEKDRTLVRTVATLAADGSVSGTTSVETQGAAQAEMRAALGSAPAQLLPQVAKLLLAKAGQTGEATLKVGDARDLAGPYSITVTFSTPERVNLPGPGALAGEIGAYGSDAKGFASAMLAVERKMDFPCPAGGSEQELELTLPGGMKISSLPRPASITSAFGTFSATHEVRDGVLHMVRKLALAPPRTVCTAADHAELRKFATAVDAELRRQVLYE